MPTLRGYTGGATTGATASLPLNITAVTNPYLVFGISFLNSGGQTVSSVVWKPDTTNPALDQSLTQLASVSNGANETVEVWGLANPSPKSGATATVTVTLSLAARLYAGTAWFANVLQVNSARNATTATGSDAAPTATVPGCTRDDVVFGVLGTDNGTSTPPAATASGDATELWNGAGAAGGTNIRGAGAIWDAAIGDTPAAWTLAPAGNWAVVAVRLLADSVTISPPPATASGGRPVFGVMMSDADEADWPNVLGVMDSLHTRLIRPLSIFAHDQSMNTVTEGLVDAALADGKDVTLTFRWGGSTSTPSYRIDDLPLFQANVRYYLDRWPSARIRFVASENEADGAGFSDTMADLLYNYQQLVLIATDEYGIPVTDCAFTAPTLALCCTDWLAETQSLTVATAFYNSFTGGALDESQVQVVLDTYAAAILGFRTTIRTHRTLGGAYQNFHYYRDTYDALRDILHYLAVESGLPLLTNEYGQWTDSTDEIPDKIDALLAGGVAYAVFYNIDNRPQSDAYPLSSRTTFALTSLGEAWGPVVADIMYDYPVFGALTLTPLPASASSSTILGGVVLGGITVTPDAASASASTSGPTVSFGGVTVTPEPATASTSTYGPRVLMPDTKGRRTVKYQLPQRTVAEVVEARTVGEVSDE